MPIIAVILAALWALGLVNGYSHGGTIHILLIGAIALAIASSL